MFLPSVPVILSHAATMEEERDHALNRPTSDEAEASLWAEEEGLLAAANRTESALRARRTPSFEALESDAHFDHVLFDAQQFGLHAAVGSEEEQDYLGLPGLLEPDQVTTLLHERQARQTRAAGARGRRAAASGPSPVSAHRALAAQRKELNKLVAAYSSKTGAAAREHPPRPAPGVRRARARGRHERAGARARGADPALVRRPSLTSTRTPT